VKKECWLYITKESSEKNWSELTLQKIRAACEAGAISFICEMQMISEENFDKARFCAYLQYR
jgi:hypothetical protein